MIEGLDAKKYARRDDLASRARRILPWLERAIGTGGAPRQLAEDVTIEVSVDPGPRYRPVDADEEILDSCRELQQLSGRTVTLVTADTAMRFAGPSSSRAGHCNAGEISAVGGPDMSQRAHTLLAAHRSDNVVLRAMTVDLRPRELSTTKAAGLWSPFMTPGRHNTPALAEGGVR